MCGILAIYYNNQEEKNIENIKSSVKEVLTKRGPDKQNFKLNNKYMVGFYRLSINDMSEKGNQPFKSGNVSMICNGEIYNHELLEKEFGLICDSSSDCECIIKLYEQVGFEQTVKLLDGVFSIILIDTTTETLYYATDRIGVRPMFKGVTKDGNIAFASLASGLSPFCKYIYRIVPGYGSYKNNKLSHTKFEYNNYAVINKHVNWSVNNFLTKAVRKRLMSDRPICCMLSGGLDSSIITSIMCKLIGSENVNTFSIGMEGASDLKYARQVSEFLGTKHTEVLFTPEEGFSVIPEIIKDLESYDITTIRASVGMWLLARYISKNTEYKVIMSGEGSDELFGGYLYFHHAPSPKEFSLESKRLIDELYLYDVLRSDRCISSHGLEVRVPFLDKYFVNLVMGIMPELKMVRNGVEKYLLRESFKNDYLPEEILWRRKDGFSDGCSNPTKSWYIYIQEFVDNIISDEEFLQNGSNFPSKEAYYYKNIYNEYFPCYQPEYNYWLPKWVEHNGDPSGRLLQVFNE